MKRILLVLGASLVLGGITHVAQGLLPDALRPFANSASGWTVLTALMVWWSRKTGWRAAALGAASFVLLVAGYTVVSSLRGYTYNPLLFGVVGVVVGPFVGLAAAWLRERGYRGAAGTALVAGIGIGEGVYGLTTVRETTGASYWVAATVAGVLLLGAMLWRRLRGVGPWTVALGGTGVVAVAFVVAYRMLGGVGG